MKYRLFVFIIAVSFLHYLNTKSFAETVLINSDIDTLSIIRYTKYLVRNPVLIFSKQQSKEVIRILGDIDSFVFKDSSWQDLVVELSGEKSEVIVNKEGIYEIYVEMSEVSEEISAFVINIDGSWWRLYKGDRILDAGRKFIKVGEDNLKEGKHVVSAIRISDYSQISEKDLKLVLVNKKEREDIEQIIWQKVNQPQTKLSYIFEEEKGKFYVP